MSPRLRRGLALVGIGGAGAIWGLGLARLLAEARFWILLYVAPPAVAAVASACALLFLALWIAWGRPPWRAAALLPLIFPLPYVLGGVAGPLAGGVLVVGGLALTVLCLLVDRAPWLALVLLAATVFGIYLSTLLPALGQADTFEFQVVAPQLGIAHPTGYPLYILLGKLFTLLPLRNVAWRLNLSSAIFAAGAVVLLYILVRRLTGRPLPALLAGAVLAFSFTFWSQAVVAEVYALHNLLATAMLWLLLGPLGRRPAAGDANRVARGWQILFLLLGLSFTNHLTTALMVPAIVLALVWDRPRLSRRRWAVGVGLLLAGLAVYAFIPLRWPALNQGQRMSLGQFLAYISGGQFHGALRLDGWRDPLRWRIVGRLLAEPFGGWGLALAAVGAGALTRRHHRRALALTGVTLLAFVAYGLCYYVPDIAVFLLPAHLILALWMGVGVAALVRVGARILARVSGRADGALSGRWVAVLALLLPLSLLWRNLPAVDQSGRRGRKDWGRYVLSLPLEPGSAILADMEKFAPLYYVQQIEGLRPDLDVVVLGNEALYRQALAERLGAGQTVYLARYLPDLAGLHLRSVGPLAEVRRAAWETPPAPERALDVEFGDSLRLLGFDVQGQADLPDRPLRLTLHWRAQATPTADLLVRLRLVDAAGRVRWRRDGARPVNGLYPTNAWAAGESVSDFHALQLPATLPPGAYRLEVGLFPPFAEEGVPAGPEGEDWLTLTPLTVGVAEALPDLPKPARVALDRAAWVSGVEAPAEAPADSPVTLTLAWRRVAPVEHWDATLYWSDEHGRRVSGVATEALSSAGAEALQRSHVITTPAQPGRYRLMVAGGAAANEPWPVHCGWMRTAAEGCPLGSVQVLSRREGAAKFGDAILLLEHQFEAGTLRPGDVIDVSLRWRGLRAMAHDYTLFVQLIGPDGRLYGQVDTWPVQGSYPTSRWRAGEEVADRHAVALEPAAPPGTYRVVVGWYLLGTMERLPVVDAQGQPIADAFTLGHFQVAP